MGNLTSYQIGEITGVIIMLLLMLGICIFFVIALVKACTTRRKGWIIAAAVSSVPFLLFLILFVIGFVAGLTRGLNHSNEITAARRGEPSNLLTAAMTPITGNAMPYEISLPLSDVWQKDVSHPPYDYLFSYRDAYVGIIPEQVGMQTPENVCDITQKNLTSKTSDCSFTLPKPIEIDSHSWLTYDATATIHLIHIKYRFYVYSDANNTFQIMTWTVPALFDRDAPVFDRIAESFKMSK